MEFNGRDDLDIENLATTKKSEEQTSICPGVSYKLQRQMTSVYLHRAMLSEAA